MICSSICYIITEGARFRDDILGTGPEGDLSRAAEGFVLKMFLWILIALS